MISTFIPRPGETCEIRSVGVKFRSVWVKTRLLFATDQLFVFEHAASGNHFCVRFGEVEIREPQEGEGDE